MSSTEQTNHHHNHNRRRGTGRRSYRLCLLPPFLLSLFTQFASATPAASLASSIDYRYFVAGGTCAAISHGITCPIDVVKTRMQSDPDKYKSLLPATATIIREEGASSLVKGLGPTLVGYGVEGALKFGIYEITKPLVVAACKTMNTKLKRSSGESLCGGPLPFIMASIMAGAVASLVLVPMESTRIRMVTDAEFSELGMIGGLRRLVEEAGLVRTLTVGLGAMLAKQVPYTYGKQVSFDIVAKNLYRILNAPRDAASETLSQTLSKSVSPEFIKWAVSVLSAMVASVMACLLSQPGDVILTETYKGSDDSDGESANKGGGKGKKGKVGAAAAPKTSADRSLDKICSAIYARHSDQGMVRALSGFFTGLQARFVHVGMIITSQLVIYDLVKQLLGLPATGSH